MKPSSPPLRLVVGYTIAILFTAFLGGNALAAPLTVHLTGGFTNQGFTIDYGAGTYDDITVSATVDLVFTPSAPTGNPTNFTSTTGQVTGTIHIWGNATYYDPFPSLVHDFDNTHGYTAVPVSLPVSYEGQTGQGGVQDLYWQITNTRDHDNAIPYRLHYYGNSNLLRLWISLPSPFWYNSNDEYYDSTGSASVSGQASVNSCLHGVVTNAATGQPIAGASVRFGNSPQTTATNGAFHYQNIPANTYQLIVANPGYDSVSNILAIPAFTIVQTNVPLQTTKVPVLLVPGWDYDPHVWDSLITALDARQIPHTTVWLVDDGGHRGGSLSPDRYAGKVGAAIDSYRKTGYEGKFDIVCHSMGAMVSRLAMERDGHGSSIRQWIGLAPVNQGAALANLRDGLALGAFALVAGIGWQDVRDDGAITAMQTTSTEVKTLMALPRAPGVIYRIMVGYNPCLTDDPDCVDSLPGDFHLPLMFNGPGKTLARIVEGTTVHSHAWTHYGDGIVAMVQSLLPGAASTDCYPKLGHTDLPRNSTVIAQVVAYLTDLQAAPLNNCPTPAQLLQDVDIGTIATDNKGVLQGGQQITVNIPSDASASEMSIILRYPGSQLGLTVFTPSGTQVVPGAYPVLQYSNSPGFVGYLIDSPATGNWSARIDAIDVPTNGEPYSFQVLLSSPIELTVGTTEAGPAIHPGDSFTLWATLHNGTNPITAASISADILKPDGQTNHLVCYDDGTHGDPVAGDGVFGASFLPTTLGTYVFSIKASAGLVQRVDQLLVEAQPAATPPTLSASSFGSSVKLTWTGPPGTFYLQGTSPLFGTNWFAEDIVPDIDSDYLHTAIVLANGQRYFRLRASQ